MRRPLSLALGLCLLGLLACCEDADETALVPAPGELNAHVLAVLETYPTDGSHGYHWPRTGAWLGFTRTLVYRGETIGEGDAKGRCHCSGLTFEVFFRAWERWWAQGPTKKPLRIGDLDAAGLRDFVRDWFGADGDRTTLAGALEGHDLGRRLADREEARAGDFVQLWRHSGSGHSCVFLGWIRNEEGEIEGLRYWSTQSSTNGIGTRVERFGDGGSSVKADELHVVRVGRERRRPAAADEE